MPSLFTLEAVYAGKGDALILHHGTDTKPQWIVIDGGHRNVYRQWLRPRLDQLRLDNANVLTDGRLPLDMVIVSHADEDHLFGLLELKDDMQAPDTGLNNAPVDIKQMWLNGFDDLAFPDLAPATPQATLFEQIVTVTDSTTPLLDDTLRHDREAMAVVASTAQGRELRDFAKTQHIALNKQFKGDLVRRDPGGDLVKPIGVGSLKITVLGPDEQRIQKLRKKWKTDLEKILEKEQAGTAAFSDQSPHNLASIMLLVACNDKTMLLTGDGRGDHLVDGLTAHGLLGPNQPNLHIDLFKIPHHGSNRNVKTATFETITAEHYLISGNGEHHNPDPTMLTMLADGRERTRGDTENYFLHLTIPDRAFEDITDEQAANNATRRTQRDALIDIDNWIRNDKPNNMVVKYRKRSELSVQIELLKP